MQQVAAVQIPKKVVGQGANQLGRKRGPYKTKKQMAKEAARAALAADGAGVDSSVDGDASDGGDGGGGKRPRKSTGGRGGRRASGAGTEQASVSDGGASKDGGDGDSDAAAGAAAGQVGDETAEGGMMATFEDDGNVDYCAQCKNTGDLICCDRCPRAYHPTCLGVKAEELPDGLWLCPVCVHDFGPDLQYDGNNGNPNGSCSVMWDGPFLGQGARVPREAGLDASSPPTLSAVRQELQLILKELMTSEFGPSFLLPVDPNRETDYHKLIRRPMDYTACLTTLKRWEKLERDRARQAEAKRMKQAAADAKATGMASAALTAGGGGTMSASSYAAGAYAAVAAGRHSQYLNPRPKFDPSDTGGDGDGDREDRKEFDPARVIADLRLVTHNCKSYNRAGSTIWRMADTCARQLETSLRDRVYLTADQTRQLKESKWRECHTLPKWTPGQGQGGNDGGEEG